MPFAKGNPGGGRPKDTPEMQEAKRLAREFSPDAMQFLIDTVRNKGAEMKYRVQCAFQILDRGLGKAPQDQSDVDLGNSHITVIVNRKCDEDER